MFLVFPIFNIVHDSSKLHEERSETRHKKTWKEDEETFVFC